MKILLLITILLALAFSYNIAGVDEKDLFDMPAEIPVEDEEGIPSFSDKIKAAKCVKEALSDVTAAKEILHDILHFKVISSIKNLHKIISTLTNVLGDCKVFFCFKPTIKKCEKETGGPCEKYGLFVYPKCKEGYSNVGCCLCRPACPEGFKNILGSCWKPKGYGRGVGYPLWDKKKCEKKHPQGCEKWAALYYPKCKDNFHNIGPNWCSANCPQGYPDIGASCLKPLKVYGRGTGYKMTIGPQCIGIPIKMEEIQGTCSQQMEVYEQLRDEVEQQFNDAIENDLSLIDVDFIEKLNEISVRYEKLTTEC